MYVDQSLERFFDGFHGRVTVLLQYVHAAGILRVLLVQTV